MKKSIIVVVASSILLLLASCAPVKFYSNSGLTEKSGIKYYTVKPFLLVERDLANSNVTKATVIYLPDLMNPQYMVMKDGLGSRKIDLKLSDGTINTFGVDSDTEIAESLNALAALISKGTSAIADINGLKGLPHAAASSTTTELYEVNMGAEGTTVKRVDFK